MIFFTQENLNKIKKKNNKRLLKSKFTAKGLIQEDIDINLIQDNFDLKDLDKINEILDGKNIDNLSEEAKITFLENAEKILKVNEFNNKKNNSESQLNDSCIHFKYSNVKDSVSNKNILELNYNNSEIKSNNICSINNNINENNLITKNNLKNQLSHVSTYKSEEINLSTGIPEVKFYTNKVSNVISGLFNDYQKKTKIKKTSKNIKNSIILSNKAKSELKDIITDKLIEDIKDHDSDFSQSKNSEINKNKSQISFQDINYSPRTEKNNDLDLNEYGEIYCKSIIIPSRRSSYNKNNEKNSPETTEIHNTNNGLLTSTYINNLNTEDKLIMNLNSKLKSNEGNIFFEEKSKNNLLKKKNFNSCLRTKNIKNFNLTKFKDLPNENILKENRNHNNYPNNIKANLINEELKNASQILVKKNNITENLISLEKNFEPDPENPNVIKEFFNIPKSFKFSFTLLFISIILILSSSIAVFTYVMSIYRWSIVNKKEMKYNYKNGTVINLFSNAMENYLDSYKYLESLKNSLNIKKEFEYFKNLEDDFNSKEMCDYYGYYMTYLNSTNLEEYLKFKNDCEIFGGGINNFGIISSYNEMKLEIQNHYKDFVSFINTEEGLEYKMVKDKWISYVNKIFSDERFQKIFLNLNEVIFNINEIYFQSIIQFNEIFFDNISLNHALVHYNLFLVIVVSFIIYLIIIYLKIDKPLKLINSSEKFIYNSIIYNIIDL